MTAFGSKWNTFLGYYISTDRLKLKKNKLNQGIIWGKEKRYLIGKSQRLMSISKENITLISTIPKSNGIQGLNIQWIGFQNKNQWMNLLSKSKFLLGLGDPLLGPSAIDAISMGCMYINPVYSKKLDNMDVQSQHPYANDRIGEPYVCSYHEENIYQLKECIQKAKSTKLEPFIPHDFTFEEYLSRVIKIFEFS